MRDVLALGREEELPRVERRGEVVRTPAAILGVMVGELREGRDVARAQVAADVLRMQLGDGARRVVLVRSTRSRS
jgi:hypothetical protein